MEYFTIAQRELVLAFKLVGVDGAVALNRKEALDAFNRVTGHGGENALPVDERPKVLILSEDVSAMLEQEVLAWQKSAQFPLIVEIPDRHGNGRTKDSITKYVQDAIGVKL